MRAGSSPSPAATAGPLGWSAVLLAMVVFHLMTNDPPLPPPGIHPPGKGIGGPRKRHNVPSCQRLLTIRRNRYYCDRPGCKRYVRNDEIADSNPLAP
ncbi:hypothetical protein ACPCHT_05335 [Nucisporomicrobium flavum]|jgi:hypothetical protein|uniref:hypothetical protein n=1 Tax=Nucisporomicrobium flavum TaxID=2785915 RepID=UPI0018F3BE4B|nr:hypothetical protein [Nucisporomicrobium flavum]